MARYYHLDIAAVAAQADHKWVDNLLSRFDIPGVGSAHQGVARRISTTGVYHIALARLINREMAATRSPRRRIEIGYALSSEEHSPSDLVRQAMAAEESSVISQDLRETSKPDRNLALELVRVTEGAAMASPQTLQIGGPAGASGGSGKLTSIS